jgi:2-polyprenyl-6-methoxyphenol hydroxylase-like FAD-dependent oxidoreductase
LVWTLLESGDALVAMPVRFVSGLQERLGRVQRLRARYGQAYVSLSLVSPIALSRIAVLRQRCAALHPVAGRGFNLGVRDMKLAQELLATPCRKWRARSSG